VNSSLHNLSFNSVVTERKNSRGVGPKSRVGFRVWQKQEFIYKIMIWSRNRLEQEQREAEGNAGCCSRSDQRGKSRQGGRQAGRQGSETRADGWIDPGTEEGQVSARK